MNMLITMMLALAATGSEPVEMRMTYDSLHMHETTPGRQPVLTYRYRNVPRKPYVMEWFTPRGLNVLRDAPADHVHHHGLMFAITVENVNFWEETDQGGSQEHRRFNEINLPYHPTVEGRAVVSETLDWRAPAPGLGDVLLVEERRIALLDSGTEARLLHWQSRLHCPESKEAVTLSGRIYHGLGMRFPEFFDGDGVFVWADDKNGAFEDGAHYLASAAWCAIQCAGPPTKEATVALFDAPDNPRPALWFTMRRPFAYLSATLDLSRQPLPLHADAPITLNYGVAVWDGVADAEQIEALYRRWREMHEEE